MRYATAITLMLSAIALGVAWDAYALHECLKATPWWICLHIFGY